MIDPSNVNPLSMVGLLLTLAGLIGSFFYIQLSQWLRDVIALNKKIELSGLGNEDTDKKGARECHVEHKRLAGWHSFAVNLIVIWFVWFTLQMALDMVDHARFDPLFGPVQYALVVFRRVFLVLSGLLFIYGCVVTFQNWKALKELPTA